MGAELVGDDLAAEVSPRDPKIPEAADGTPDATIAEEEVEVSLLREAVAGESMVETAERNATPALAQTPLPADPKIPKEIRGRNIATNATVTAKEKRTKRRTGQGTNRRTTSRKRRSCLVSSLKMQAKSDQAS